MKLVTDILRNLVNSGCQRKKDGNISAPFIFTIDISQKYHPFNADRLREILSRIIPHSYQIFIEGNKSTTTAEIFPTLEFLDKHKVLYHLQTNALWENPSLIIRRLRRLRYLSTLRIEFPSLYDQNQASLIGEHHRMAVYSGISVWTVASLVPITIKKLKEVVSVAKELGSKGISFKRCIDTECIDKETLYSGYRDLQELYREGYPVILDDCPPAGMNCGLNSSCRGGFGSCFVDAHGNVRTCRHSDVILGNLLVSRIEDMWSNSDFRKLLSCHADNPKSLHTIERFNPDHYHAVLDSSLCPVPLFWLRNEPSGALLVRGYDFVSVSEKAARIVMAMDGNRNLKSFKNNFGQEALDLIYALFRHQFVRFERNGR